MTKYREILRLKSLGLSQQSIADSCNVSKKTVNRVLKRAKELNISWPLDKSDTDAVLAEMFFPSAKQVKSNKRMPDYDYVHKELLRNGVSKKLLWTEYMEDCHANGEEPLMYSQFCYHIQQDEQKRRATMHINRKPGEQVEVDWVGDQPELLLDTTTGELRKVHIFTTTLGFSSLVYAEIFPDEKLPHFITGTVHALSYYGAVPKYLVPDNLRTAVTRHSKDELVLQSAFSDLETFYDTIILPPPPRKPKGKPTVENHVRFLETHLVEELKKDTYTSLEALNAAVKKIVADINQRPFQKKSDIRKSRMNGFEKYDKPRMNQLPGESYTLCDYKYFLKVPDNYHLEYDAHYYSVLYTYKGKPAILKATMTEIRICDEYNRLICRHPRSYRDFPLYITDDNHMPPEHLYYKEVNAHDGAYYRRWASVYGESMVTLIDRILRSSKHEEQAYNSCAGVLHSCKDVPHRLVQEAAEKCVEANACKYSYFKKVLSMVQNNHSSSAINGTGKLPSHTNIRGKEAYK